MVGTKDGFLKLLLTDEGCTKGLLQNDFSPSLEKRKNYLNLLIKFRNNLLISIPASTSKKIEEKKEKRKVKRIILFFTLAVFGYSIKQMYLSFFSIVKTHTEGEV